MSDKFIFQNARIKSMETKLMSSAHVQRLTECASLDDAFKLLAELGFGSGTSVENNDFDTLFKHEEAASTDVLRSFNVENGLDVFLLENDYHNLKALLKASISGAENPVLMPYGIYEIEKLKVGILGDTSSLPQIMADVIHKILKMISDEKITPRMVDTLTDAAKYNDIFSRIAKSDKLLRAYFVKKVDYLNILTYLRCRRLGLNAQFFTDSFVAGGGLEITLFTSCYESPLEAFKEKCRYTAYQDSVAAAVESGNLIALEVAQDDELLKMWRDEKDDMFSASPIVAYYLTKMTGIKIAKLAVSGIKNHVANELIKERMREIYA